MYIRLVKRLRIRKNGKKNAGKVSHLKYGKMGSIVNSGSFDKYIIK